MQPKNTTIWIMEYICLNQKNSDYNQNLFKKLLY